MLHDKCPTGCLLLYPPRNWGLSSLGMYVSATEQHSKLEADSTGKRSFSLILERLVFQFFLIAFYFNSHCLFYCLLPAISKFTSPA